MQDRLLSVTARRHIPLRSDTWSHQHSGRSETGAICAAENFRNFRFVRQALSDPDVVDFLRREARFIVEVVGATYSENHESACDRRRDAYPRVEGYRIVRVLNDDIHKHITDILHMNLIVLKEGCNACGTTAPLRYAALIRPSGTFSRAKKRGRRGSDGEVGP
jgi:very-short-patch-repair endonuclease